MKAQNPYLYWLYYLMLKRQGRVIDVTNSGNSCFVQIEYKPDLIYIRRALLYKYTSILRPRGNKE